MTKNTEPKIPDRSNTIQSAQKSTAEDFNIVYIAYGEVSAMSGEKDQPSTCKRDGSGEGGDVAGKEFECMARIASLPLIKSTAVVMSNFYSSVKQSNSVVQMMFDNVEEGWSKGAEAVGPVTARIEETLERPLRAMDGAACVGLDFLEKKVPSVKLPPEEMYAKSKEYLGQRVLTPVVDFTCTFLDNVRDRVSQYASNRETVTQKEAMDDPGKNGTGDVAKNRK